MSRVEYLYHYTNVDTLALILANKTIRFKSLDQLDDLQEQKSEDIENIGRFCYVSSWTEDEKESIPMWNIYTDLNRGVRIKLQKNPFKKYDYSKTELENGLKLTIDDETGNVICNDKIKINILLDDMISKQFWGLPLWGDILYQVQYTSDKDKLYPTLLDQYDGYHGLEFISYGKYKNLYWEFQKEWRYIFYTIPLPETQSEKLLTCNLCNIYSNMKAGKQKQLFKYYDFKIDEDVFTDMEITMSPRIADGMKIIVSNLVKEYNPSAVVKQSELNGLL